MQELYECRSAEVFRLPAAPSTYLSKTTSGQKETSRWGRFDEWKRSTCGYVNDFVEFISNDRKNNPGFQYELIYSDPP